MSWTLTSACSLYTVFRSCPDTVNATIGQFLSVERVHRTRLWCDSLPMGPSSAPGSVSGPIHARAGELRGEVKGCLPFAALALAGLLVWPFVAGAIVIKLVLAVWVLGFGSIALAKLRFDLEKRDKYDLKRLKSVHERKELRGANVPLVAHDADEAVCPHCGQGYDARLPSCPRCRS